MCVQCVSGGKCEWTLTEQQQVGAVYDGWSLVGAWQRVGTATLTAHTIRINFIGQTLLCATLSSRKCTL
jgi:hypothetical protein